MVKIFFMEKDFIPDLAWIPDVTWHATMRYCQKYSVLKQLTGNWGVQPGFPVVLQYRVMKRIRKR